MLLLLLSVTATVAAFPNDTVNKLLYQNRHFSDRTNNESVDGSDRQTDGSSDKGNGTSVTPIILIPGIFGSQLDGLWNKTSVPHYFCYKTSGDWTTLWLSFEIILPKVIDCWVDNMLLNFTDNTFRDRDGVKTRVNDFGGTKGIECLDQSCYYPYFKAMVDSIMQIPGYTKNVSLRAAPYDFRYGANSPVGRQYLRDLMELIEETYSINKNQKVNLVAHSMGNLYMIEFFKNVGKSWKQKYISKYIAISGVFGGSVKSLRALVSGEVESIPRVLVNANSVRLFQRTFQSIYWLLPKKQLWDDEEVLVFTPDKNYTVQHLADLMDAAGNTDGRAILKTLDGSLGLEDPGVDVYCVYGSEIPTAAQFRWKPGYFPDYQPEQIDDVGDGTVNKRSLEVCTRFSRVKGTRVYPGIKHGEHMQILLNPDVIEYVIGVITGTVADGKGRHNEIRNTVAGDREGEDTMGNEVEYDMVF